jgi:hypothetical protein
MAIIIKCDQCNKQMGSLEPFAVKNDKYLCLKCAEQKDQVQEQENAIICFYKNVEIRHLNDFSS